MNRLIEFKQLHQLVLAHARELFREPAVLFWGIIFPILMSLGLGIAFTRKADIVRNVAVIREIRGNDQPVLKDFLKTYQAKPGNDHNHKNTWSLTIPDDKMGNTTIVFQEMTWKEAMVALKRGNINLIMDEKDGKNGYHFDPLNPDAQLVYMKLRGMFGNPEILKKGSNADIIPLTVSGTRYIDFLVPGLIAMGVMMSIMWGISYEIIDNRSKKLLRRMVATPMKKSHYLLALITVRILMNFVESGLLFLFAWLVFGLKIQGNPAALLLVFVTGNLCFAGIAIFMSSHTAKTEIGNGLINLVSMPMMVLSGIFFSYHNFPEWAIPVIQLLPLTMLADGVRGVMIEGAGFAEIMMPAVILGAMGLAFFTAGLRIFKWH